jgi:hypothetical protein
METRKLNEIILHFRQYSATGVLKNNQGRTVMIVREGNQYKMAEARCGKRDNFNRSTAIAIVRGRMVCERKIVNSIVDGDALVNYLTHLNNRYREQYDSDFFKRLLSKLA